jgi:hypothetical protein
MGWSETELLHHYPFLMNPAWTPKAHRYLFRLVLDTVRHGEDLEIAGNPEEAGRDLERHVSELLRRILALPCAEALPQDEDLPDRVFTHQLELDADFLDFLRLGLRWRKASTDAALNVRKETERLASSLDPHGSPRPTVDGDRARGQESGTRSGGHESKGLTQYANGLQ